ncbi:MAG: hypothetical protein ACXWUR_03210 [Allosphingosinicella sp.]
MRRRPELILATALGLAGCSFPAANEADGAQGKATDQAATLVISGDGPAACTASWNGEAVTKELLRERSWAHLERAVAAAGGPGQMQELPTVRVETPLATRWSCARPWLAALEQSGYPRVQLVTGENDYSGPFATFPIPGMAPPRATVAVGPAGSLAWDGEKLDAAGLRRRVMVVDHLVAPEPVVGAIGVRLAADGEATMEAVLDATVILGEGAEEPILATGEAIAPATAPAEPDRETR